MTIGGPCAGETTLPFVLIKPSHYDDDGYVIRWWRAMIPSNSLAALYGVAADCAEPPGSRTGHCGCHRGN